VQDDRNADEGDVGLTAGETLHHRLEVAAAKEAARRKEAEGWFDYDLPPELVGIALKGKYRGQRQKWFLFRYLGTDAQIDIATDHAEFSTWRWVDVDELVAGIVPFKRAVYAEVVAAFRAYLA